MLLMPGKVVFDGNKDEYIVGDLLGNGAFGYVFQIKSKSDNSYWALKTIPSFPSEASLHSFINESQLAVKVAHPNVIKYLYVHDGNTYENLPPYIIMEYANGGTLMKLLESYRKNKQIIDNKLLHNYFMQLVNGMKSVNDFLVHRDIKPDNILIHEDQLKISDFGLSKVASEKTRTLTFKGIGHLKYMAPEGWRMDTNTTQMDIYSMGLVFYELATLKFPYNVKNESDIKEWQEAHLFSNPPIPNTINNKLSPLLSNVILKMISKSVNDRFKNWQEIEQQLLKDNEPSNSSVLINNLLNIQLAKDSSQQAAILKQQKVEQEKMEFFKLISYQFNMSIYSPLKKIIDEFNNKYQNGKIRMSEVPKFPQKEIDISVKMLSGRNLYISLRSIIDEDFYRVININDFGETIQRKQLCRPNLRGKKVLAWGYMCNSDRRGFNIVLIEKDNDIYGEWLVLKNSNSGFSNRHREEPFFFEYEEFEKEIQHIGVMHIYNTEILPLNIEEIFVFFAS